MYCIYKIPSYLTQAFAFQTHMFVKSLLLSRVPSTLVNHLDLLGLYCDNFWPVTLHIFSYIHLTDNCLRFPLTDNCLRFPITAINGIKLTLVNHLDVIGLHCDLIWLVTQHISIYVHLLTDNLINRLAYQYVKILSDFVM